MYRLGPSTSVEAAIDTLELFSIARLQLEYIHKSQSEKMKPLVLFGHTRPVSQVQFNEEGDLLFTSGRDSNMNVWDVETGELLGTYDGHRGAVQGFDVTRDSQYLATGSADGYIRIFAALTGELLVEHKLGAVVRCIEWARDSLRLVTANDKWSAGEKIAHAVTIWTFDVESKSITPVLRITEALPMKAQQVRWGPFDETLVSIHEDGSLFVWDTKTGDALKEVRAHGNNKINKLRFSTDRKLAVTSSADHTAKLWQTAEWTLVRVYSADRPLNDAVVSPIYRGTPLKREHIIMGGGQEARDVTTTGLQEGKFETLFYHLVQESELGKVKGHFGPLHTLSWSPNGKAFASGSEDGFVRLHKLDPDYVTRKWE